MDENVELWRQRILEEQLRAQTTIDADQRQIHLGLARLFEERLLALRENSRGSMGS